MNADADEPSVGSTLSIRVGDRGRQGVGRSTSVDDVHQPHSSLMCAGITKPTPTPRQSSVIDVVHPPSMGVCVVHSPSMSVDVTRPMPVGGTHLPSMGAGVVGCWPRRHVSLVLRTRLSLVLMILRV